MKKPTRKTLIYGAFALWASVVAVGLSFLMAGHFVVFPIPEDKLEQAMLKLQKEEGALDKWFAVHFIAQHCRCSSEALAEILRRGPRENRQEMVMYIGDEIPEELGSSSLKTRMGEEGHLSREFAVQAVPLLALMSPKGELVYKGGYSKTRNGPVLEDTIIEDAIRGNASQPLPLFGCALSKEMQDTVDPLGLKYK